LSPMVESWKSNSPPAVPRKLASAHFDFSAGLAAPIEIGGDRIAEPHIVTAV
jgi:hypothetical protein